MFNKKVNELTEALDMGAIGASKMMGIAVQSYRNKKACNSFNERNYNNLVSGLKKYIENI